MPDENKERDEQQTDEAKINKPVELDVSVSYNNNSAVKNGTVASTDSGLERMRISIGRGVSFSSSDGDTKNFSTLDYALKTDNAENETTGLQFQDLKDYYQASGNDAAKTYTYLKNTIIENKDNSDFLRTTVSDMLGELSDSYDDNQEHKDLGSPEKVLDSLMNMEPDEKLSGLVCATIHEFMMTTLNDCGIKAALVCGTQEDGNHATLIYQVKDGEYIWNNYDCSMVVEASNIKDAIREVYKNNSTLQSFGNITIIGKDGSYQEYAFKEESAFGDKMDKRDYNSKVGFEMDTKTSLNGNVTYSNTGISANAGVNLAYENENKASATSLNAGYKNNSKTSMFMESQSIGLNVGHSTETKSENKSNFFSVDGVVSYIKGKIPAYRQEILIESKFDSEAMYNDIKAWKLAHNENLSEDEIANFKSVYGKGKIETQMGTTRPAETKEYLTTFVNIQGGEKKTLVEDGNLKLENTANAGLMGNVTFCLKGGIGGDARILAEDALTLTTSTPKAIFTNTLNGGLVGDLRLTSGEQKPSVQPGVKLNFQSGVDYKPNDNTQIKAEAGTYAVVTNPSKDYGVEGSLFAAYRPSGSKSVVFGSASAAYEGQRLTIGGFNEKTENNLSLQTTLGVQLSSNSTVSATYKQKQDWLNSTRNNSEFTLNYRMNF